MRRLVVNADDFGLTPGVNRAVLELAAAGALTSATLMAGAGAAEAAAAEAAAMGARGRPTLGVGCHVVLLDGEPVAEAAEVSSLLRPGTGAFYPTLAEFLRALFSGTIRHEHMVAEVLAQLKRLQGLGIQPTHVDTHKHTHMFPRVLRAVLSAAEQAGVGAIRNPMEPGWAVAAARGAGTLRKLEVSALRTMYAGSFVKTVRAAGFRTTDGALGVAATGSLDEATLRALVEGLPDGDWELVCHPGYVDAALGQVQTRLRESREVERDCLMRLPEMLPPDTQLINFGELGELAR